MGETVAMTPGSIILLHPGWLSLLLVMLVIMMVARYSLRRHPSGEETQVAESDFIDQTGMTTSATFSDKYSLIHPLLKLIPRAKPSTRQRWVNYAVFWVVLTCLVLSLCQPVRVGKPLTTPPHERDIVFIVDTSLSMILRDYVYQGQRIERINVLKRLLTDFVQRLKGERIAIVVFGDTAQTLVPLTRDKQLLTNMIKRISAGMLSRENAMGDAITLAVHEAKQAKQHKRILVLFTDAGDDTGHVTPLAAAQLAADAGLPLYTIAIGASTSEAAEKSRFPGLIYQTVDTTLLQTLSQKTGATSYQASNSDTLQRSIASITRKPSAPRKVAPHYELKALYIWPLLFGLFVFTMQQIMRQYRLG